MKLVQLNQNSIAEISDRITCPSYNRDEVSVGVVHIGVGGFHRSHQAYYIHQLLENYELRDWGICGVGLRESDRAMYDVLKKQDGLYTLTIQQPDGTNRSEVIGSIKEMLLAVDNPEMVIDKMAHRNTKIVSLTITEGGYNFHPQSGDFDFENPDVQFEMLQPEQPKTVFGYLTAALKKRKLEGLPPFTILSCDNIQHNGDVARQMLLAFAERQNPELAQWIQENVTFPNSMVDRITPVTKPADISYLKETYQLEDGWPVISEPFIQWVIEDNFCNGRPPLEKLGVQFVPNVSPYEKMKIRLLNAGHSVLGIPGALHGHALINDCMNDHVFAKFMRQFMDEEVSPILDPIDGIDIEAYKDTLEERFANPNIKDSVSRICSESSAKLPKFLIPTIQDNLNNGGSIKYATFVLAAWHYYTGQGRDEKNISIEIIDTKQSELRKVATEKNPLNFLSMTEVFGDLLERERFSKMYQEMVQLIYKTRDVRSLMADVIGGN